MFGLPKYGNGIGFKRLLAFCSEQQIDIEALGKTSVVITGSNGKGSTTKFVYECLRTSIPQVGCFTSPHLFDLRERFEISGRQIDDTSLNEYVRRILAFNDKLLRHNDSMGAFELLFLVAVLWFTDNDVTSVVWEAGIGGRYDPIRVLRSPISALTSIDLEHTELLGPTKQLIAFDKLDATRPSGVTFVSPAVEAHLTLDLDAFARVTGRTLVHVADAARIDAVARHADSMYYSMSVPAQLERVRVTIPLLGLHQIYNSATAIHVATAYFARLDMPFNLTSALKAVSDTKWPGRLERISADPEIWIDVGHTPEALELVSETLESMFPPSEVLVVFGVSANKAVHDIAAIIRRHFPHVILTQAYKGGLDAHQLAVDFDQSQLLGVTDTIEDAVKLSRTLATDRGLKVAVLGGLFLAVEFAYVLRGKDPRTLEFF